MRKAIPMDEGKMASTLTVRDAESKIFALVLLATATFGFFARFFPKAGNLVDLLMLGVSLFTVLFFMKSGNRLKKDQIPVALVVILLALSLAVSLFMHLRLNAAVQFLLYFAYLTPLLLLTRVSPKSAYRVFLPLLLFIGLIQLPIDLLFPKLDEHLLDAFSGTFTVANNKSRYLFILIVAIAFIYRFRSKHLNWTALPLALLAMTASFILGGSIFVYLFGTLAFFLALFHKRRYLIFPIAAVLVLAAYYAFTVYDDDYLVMITYNRFFDSTHGVYGVVDYAFRVIGENLFLGTGLGEFVSRTSQSMEGLYLSSVPRTMITFGKIYEETAAPTGLPSYVLFIAESGVIGLFVSALLIYCLYRYSHPSYLGFAFFIYVLLITMFLPMFYEGPDGAVLLYTYVLVNKALAYKNTQGGSPVEDGKSC